MDETELIENIAQLQRRLRRARAVEALFNWAPAAGWLTLLIVVLSKLSQADLTQALPTLICFPLLCAGGALARYARPPSMLATAAAADRELGTKQRLLTATEWVLRERPRTGVATFMLTDAAAQLRGLDLDQTFKSRPPLPRGPLALLLLSVALLFTPTWRLFSSEPTAEELRLHDSASRISEMARRLPAEKAQDKRLAEELKRLARQLKEPGVGNREAASRIAAARRRIKEEAERKTAGQREALQRVTQAAEKARQNGSPEAQQALDKALQEASQAMPEDRSTRAALEEARQHLAAGDERAFQEALSEALESQANEQRMQSEQLQEIAEALAREQGRLSPDATPGEGKAVTLGEAPPQTGEGEGPADFGKGTTNRQESGQGEPQNRLASRQSETESDWEEEFEKLYESERVEKATGDVKASGQMGSQGGFLKVPGEVRGLPMVPDGPKPGAAEQVYLEYRREAEQAVARDTIPAQYRDTVRNYFDTIDPRR